MHKALYCACCRIHVEVCVSSSMVDSCELSPGAFGEMSTAAHERATETCLT